MTYPLQGQKYVVYEDAIHQASIVLKRSNAAKRKGHSYVSLTHYICIQGGPQIVSHYSGRCINGTAPTYLADELILPAYLGIRTRR